MLLRYSVDQIEALLSSLGNKDLKSPTDARCVRASIQGWKQNVSTYIDQGLWSSILILKYVSGWGAVLEEFECLDGKEIF